MTEFYATHEEHNTPEEFRDRVRKLFCQPKKTMVDIILDRDRPAVSMRNRESRTKFQRRRGI
ncbi:MAG: hypothetical protein M0Z75_10460 [Nitrospiraceae bacterium]|nr:hypothetical protein [Nitrospiraceae bacterium]